MAQKLKKSSLFFGQADQGQDMPKPTLSSLYKDVGESQTGAVRDVVSKTKEATTAVPGQFGISYDPTGTASFAKDSKFRPVAALTTTTTAPETPVEKLSTVADATAAATKAQQDVQTLEKEQSEAETALEKSTGDLLTKAGDTSKTAQEALTEKKLGERRAPSEMEKAAKDYRNVLQTTPGTSNVEAVANLMKFYDPKYKTLESSLRQGEISIARQQAGITEAGLQQAEGERVGAIQEYKEASTKSYEDAKKLIDKQKQEELKNIKDFYGKKLETAGKTATDAAAKAAEIQRVEDEAATNISNALFTSIDSGSSGLTNVLSAISGRAGDNWLNTRGNEVLRPIQSDMNKLSEDARRINNDPSKNPKDRQKELREVALKTKRLKIRAAGELSAFLADQNTKKGDALDAAEQIMAAGLIVELPEPKKAMIRDRIRKDRYINTRDKNNMSSPDKLQKIYEAFGGKDDIRNEAIAWEP